jgi:hypothetical protein
MKIQFNLHNHQIKQKLMNRKKKKFKQDLLLLTDKKAQNQWKKKFNKKMLFLAALYFLKKILLWIQGQKLNSNKTRDKKLI